MNKQDLQKLIKVESRIKQIVNDDLGLKTYDVEFTICNPQDVGDYGLSYTYQCIFLEVW